MRKASNAEKIEDSLTTESTDLHGRKPTQIDSTIRDGKQFEKKGTEQPIQLNIVYYINMITIMHFFRVVPCLPWFKRFEDSMLFGSRRPSSYWRSRDDFPLFSFIVECRTPASAKSRSNSSASMMPFPSSIVRT